MNNIRSVVLIIVALFFPYATTMEKDEEFGVEEDVWIQPRNGSLCSFKGKFINQCRQVATLAADLPVNTATCSRTDEENPIGIEIDNHTLALVMKGIEAAQENPFLTFIEGDKEIIEAFAYLDVDEKFHLPLLKLPAAKLLEMGVAAVESDVAFNSYCSSVKNIHPKFQQKLMALIFNTRSGSQTLHRVQRFQNPSCLKEPTFTAGLNNNESTFYLFETDRPANILTIHPFDVASTKQEVAQSHKIEMMSLMPSRFIIDDSKNILTFIYKFISPKKGLGLQKINLSTKTSNFSSYREVLKPKDANILSVLRSKKTETYPHTPQTQIAAQYCGKEENELGCFDLLKQENPVLIRLPNGTHVRCAALNNSGTLMATILHSPERERWRGNVSIWDTQQGTEIETLEHPSESPHCADSYAIHPSPEGTTFVTFSPDDRYLATLILLESKTKKTCADIMVVMLYHLASKTHVHLQEECAHVLSKLFVSNNGIVTTVQGKNDLREHDPRIVFSSFTLNYAPLIRHKYLNISQYDMFNQKKVSSFWIDSKKTALDFIVHPHDGHVSFCTQDNTHACMWHFGESVEKSKITFPIAALAEYIRRNKKSDINECPDHIQKTYNEEESKKSELWKLLKRYLDTNKSSASSVLSDCCKELAQETGT